MMEADNTNRLEYIAKKYGRVTLLLLIVFFVIFTFSGVRPSINVDGSEFGSSRSGTSVAIQGSKHVNPHISSEYWTSNKFDF